MIYQLLTMIVSTIPAPCNRKANFRLNTESEHNSPSSTLKSMLKSSKDNTEVQMHKHRQESNNTSRPSLQ